MKVRQLESPVYWDGLTETSTRQSSDIGLRRQSSTVILPKNLFITIYLLFFCINQSINQSITQSEFISDTRSMALISGIRGP